MRCCLYVYVCWTELKKAEKNLTQRKEASVCVQTPLLKYNTLTGILDSIFSPTISHEDAFFTRDISFRKGLHIREVAQYTKPSERKSKRWERCIHQNAIWWVGSHLLANHIQLVA